MSSFVCYDRRVLLGSLLLTLVALRSPAQTALTPASRSPSLEQVLSYPYVAGLVASPKGDRFAWVENVRGVRNVWYAQTEGGTPHCLTRYTADDGQELSELAFSEDGSQLIFVRGGDHDENWPAKGNLQPDPDNSPREPKVTIWTVRVDASGSTPVEVAEGDSPALSSTSRLAYLKDGQVWTAPFPAATAGAAKAERLFFDRGEDSAPVWSPDGSHLAFVSGRGDHSFIGVYSSASQPLVYLAPTTHHDTQPVWSPDGRSIAFLRQPSPGDEPQDFTVERPHPFALWVADAAAGEGRRIWSSPETLAGSLPDFGPEPLFWMADNRLVFRAELDNWAHLYDVDAAGGEAHLLTPGNFIVEDVASSPDHRSLVYSANTGGTPGDEDRRHLFRLELNGQPPKALTPGDGLEWSPAALAGGAVAYVLAGAQQPPGVAVLAQAGTGQLIDPSRMRDYPSASLVVPTLVSFKSPDGLTVQGQLFRAANAKEPQPAVIFLHGGPPRQMLLGWHYMDYYSNGYAVNQYLAAHGFTVLSVNYRLGIGYGRDFQHPEHAGPAGASEYQDVLAGARYLQQLAGVDGKRIGIWGGSYGGYLTGLALARNSDVFKAGVDLHGIANWIPDLAKDGALPDHWYEAGPAWQPEWQKAIATAFAASPDADIARWTSPVLLVQGDDDRNVSFDQTVELAHRLEQQHTPFEELVLPNEIHGFLRFADWLKADGATVEFLSRQLGARDGAR